MKIIFNEKEMPHEQISTIITSLASPEIISEKGGFIFKCYLRGDEFHFGILPSFLDGERTYHYNINVGGDRPLIGFINPNMTMTIIFKLNNQDYKNGLSEELKNEYRTQYKALADFLSEMNFPMDFKIDKISSDVIEKMGIFKSKISQISNILNAEKRRLS